MGEIQHFKYLVETQKRKCKNSFVLEANKYAGGNKKLQKLHLCLHAISLLTWQQNRKGKHAKDLVSKINAPINIC